MKKFLVSAIALLSLLVISSCESTVTKYKTDETYKGLHFEVMVVDSCEYLVFNTDMKSFTHKGNCKFCAARDKKRASVLDHKSLPVSALDTTPIINYKHPFDGGKVYITKDNSAIFRAFSFRDSNVTVVSGRDTMDFQYEHHQEFNHERIDIMFAMTYLSLQKINEDTLVSTEGIKYIRNKSNMKR